MSKIFTSNHFTERVSVFRLVNFTGHRLKTLMIRSGERSEVKHKRDKRKIGKRQGVGVEEEIMYVTSLFYS